MILTCGAEVGSYFVHDAEQLRLVDIIQSQCYNIGGQIT